MRVRLHNQTFSGSQANSLPQVFSNISVSTNPTNISPSCPLPTELCAITAADPFLVSVAVWSTLQLSWTIVLLASQVWQIARQMTTLEVSNLGRYGFMGGRGGASLSGQMGHQNQHRQVSASPDPDDGTSLEGVSPGHVHQHVSVCGGCGSGFLMNLLGLDRFTKGKATTGLARAGKATNPFDLGVVGNCKDFWTAGRELGVEYDKLYDVPLEGFRQAKLRREREDNEDDHSMNSRKSMRKNLLMGLGLGRVGSSRAGYEPVNQV